MKLTYFPANSFIRKQIPSCTSCPLQCRKAFLKQIILNSSLFWPTEAFKHAVLVSCTNHYIQLREASLFLNLLCEQTCESSSEMFIYAVDSVLAYYAAWRPILLEISPSVSQALVLTHHRAIGAPCFNCTWLNLCWTQVCDLNSANCGTQYTSSCVKYIL